MTDTKGLRLGDRVACTAYIRPSGNHFELDNSKKWPTAYYWANGAEAGVEVDGYLVCDKFVTKETRFTGVFVGWTQLCTELMCESGQDYNGNEFFACRSENPQDFAIVYYAENKKRLVPMDKIEAVKE